MKLSSSNRMVNNRKLGLPTLEYQIPQPDLGIKNTTLAYGLTKHGSDIAVYNANQLEYIPILGLNKNKIKILYYKMGFISAPYKVRYIVANSPYVCIGSNIDIRRNITGNDKYTINCMFDIHYSLEERQTNPQRSIIDTKFYSQSFSNLPDDIITLFYDKIKADLTVVQDNL